MKKIIYFFLFIPLISFSQSYDANWFFGDSLILKFSDTEVTASKVSGQGRETSISYSDSLGSLLFYCNGARLWNMENEEMEQSGLNIDQLGTYGSSVAQGSIAIPDPGNINKFYIINHIYGGMAYSKLDMTLDGGLGDIEEENKDVVFFEGFLSEHLQAVKHANGRDWWVFFHEDIPSFEDDSTNTFYSVLITPDGMSDVFEQQVGKKYKPTINQMVFSKDGSLLAFPGINGFEIFNFDRCGGTLSLYKSVDEINGDSFNPYGCAFSDDGSKLYLSNAYGTGILFQYCLTCDAELSDTRQLIYKLNDPAFVLGQMLLGPDNHIYLITLYGGAIPNNVFEILNMNLSVINNPNEEGAACDFDTSTIWLGGRRTIAGLPNMPNYNLGALIGSPCDTITAIENISNNEKNFTVYPNPVDQFLNISYEAASSPILITISDLLGNELFMKQLEKDENFTSLNLSKFHAGIYIYTLSMNNQIIQKGRIAKL